MREKLETLPVAELRELAKAQGLKGVSSMRKAELIELLCQQAEKTPQVKPTQTERPAEASPASAGADRENARASRGNDRDTAQQSRGADRDTVQASRGADRDSAQPYRDASQQSRGNERDTYRARGNDRDNTQPASQDREAQSAPRAQESQRQPRGPVVYDSRQGRTDSRMADPRRTNRPYDKNGQSGGNRYYNNSQSAPQQAAPSYGAPSGEERQQRTDMRSDALGLNNQDLAELDSGIEANGILEVMPDGFGFIRCENILPG